MKTRLEVPVGDIARRAAMYYVRRSRKARLDRSRPALRGWQTRRHRGSDGRGLQRLQGLQKKGISYILAGHGGYDYALMLKKS